MEVIRDRMQYPREAEVNAITNIYFEKGDTNEADMNRF